MWNIIILSFYLASVSLIPNVRDVLIDCPGDMFYHNCTILSNSETIHLTWRITLPGQLPFNLTYDMSSSVGDTLTSGNIRTLLTTFVDEQSVASILELTLSSTENFNLTQLECLIDDLGSDSFTVFVNASGELVNLACVCVCAID